MKKIGYMENNNKNFLLIPIHVPEVTFPFRVVKARRTGGGKKISFIQIDNWLSKLLAQRPVADHVALNLRLSRLGDWNVTCAGHRNRRNIMIPTPPDRVASDFGFAGPGGRVGAQPGRSDSY